VCVCACMCVCVCVSERAREREIEGERADCSETYVDWEVTIGQSVADLHW
jgi:hypothetical protein